MANTYKNIVITPNTGSSTGDPSIVFSGANANVNTDITLRVYPTSNGTLSFEGSAGQLLTITNDLSNTIFSVNDVSGLPLIEVNVTSQQITFGQYYGNVGIGTAAANSSIYKLDVAGSVNISLPTLLVAGQNVLAAIGAGNTYAVSVGAASNNWANTVAGYANAWANTKVSSVTGTAGQIFSSGGTTPTINLISTGVSATTYGGATQIPAIVVDSFGRITSASNVAFSSGSMDYAYANAVGAGANTWANTKLSNTSGVSFAGDLYFPTGNVGIGINAPTSNLHVVGSANVSSSLRVGGRVNIGSAPSANIQVYAGATPNTLDTYVVLTDATIGSNTTSSASAFTSNPSTVAASFTLSSLNHFLATQGTIGAGSAVTNQRGFYAFNSLTGATNNYGFYSDIASGANRWNFYASGTAYNFFQGGSGFGTGPTAYSQIRMGGTAPSSSALSYSLYADQTAPSTTTDEFASYYSTPSTAAASFTLGSMFHYIAVQGTIGASSAITNQYGFYVGSNMTGATNNYGYYSNIPVGANRWNLYMNGTANNYIAGNVGIGTTSPSHKLDVSGSANISNSLYVDTIYGSNRPEGNLTIQTTANNLGAVGVDSIYFKTINSSNPLTIDSFGGVWLGLLPSPKPFSSDSSTTSLWMAYDISMPSQGSLNFNTYAVTGTYRRTATGYAQYIGTSANGAITFNSNGISGAANSTVTLTERMRISANGNVSIGRVSDNYRLDVNGSINIAAGGAIAGGFTVDSFNAGANIAAYGTWTPNPANGNYQYVTSNGSVTIAVPTSNCAIDVLWYNGVSPGSVTFSGYQAASGGGGDSYLTTANYEYILSIRRINGVSTYVWKALQ